MTIDNIDHRFISYDDDDTRYALHITYRQRAAMEAVATASYFCFDLVPWVRDF